MRLGELIRSSRESHRISQRDLSAAIGVDHSYISDIERGTRFPARDLLASLAAVLGLPVDELESAWQAGKAQLNERRLQRTVPFLSNEEIESIVLRDRATALRRFGKSEFSFPRDRDAVAKLLCKVSVVYDEQVLGAERVGKRYAFAGAFRSYRGTSPAFVIATRFAKDGRNEPVTERTKTFQLFHEIGHAQLHWSPLTQAAFELAVPEEPVFCSSGESRVPIEFQANAYAAAFLMPASEVRRLLGGRRTLDMREHGRDLCNRFYVEPWTLRIRLKNLGIRVL